MKQLNRFSAEWLKEHILTSAPGKWLIHAFIFKLKLFQPFSNFSSGDTDKLKARREKAYNRFTNNISSKTARMLHIYNNENEDGEKRCGYFDPLTTHGGPQLNQPVSLVEIDRAHQSVSYPIFILSNPFFFPGSEREEANSTTRVLEGKERRGQTWSAAFARAKVWHWFRVDETAGYSRATHAWWVLALKM